MTDDIDITAAIAAKSDQLNADDLLGGPRTIRIRDVSVARSEQPVSIFFDGDEGRPWKPGKTPLRILAAIWGTKAARWKGLHCTIYCDETVTWGGQAVGGIRPSHMEGLTEPRTLMLTKTRGKKVPVTIQPLTIERASAGEKWRTRLFAVANGGGELTVQEAWEKVPAPIREELGDDLLEQLLGLEAAAQKERSDAAGSADALNAEMGDGD